MIKAEHLYKRYGNREVVSDLSLTVNRGEVLGFIGANGAGKSTTIKLLCGVLPLYAGKIEICGIDITENPRMAKSKIGYLPENAPLPSNMTVLSFLDYAAAMHGLSGKAKRDAIDQSLERCSLFDMTGMEIEALSKGYKRRLCLAQTLLHKPEVLLLDEPTDGLDPNQKREIRNLIQVLRQDTEIIISTHILEEIRSVCTHVLLLNQGKTMFRGTVDEFVKQEEKLFCEALTLNTADIANAAALLREHCPGMARINGNQLIVPAQAEIAQIETLLSNHGIKINNRETVNASLDDVFSSFTLPMTIKPDRPKTTEEKQSETNNSPETEDDDD